MQGLNFLHGSILGLHGRLSSSNCTIDSRFVLKLTDFGLHEFNKTAKQEEDKKTSNKDSKRWLNESVFHIMISVITEQHVLY